MGGTFRSRLLLRSDGRGHWSRGSGRDVHLCSAAAARHKYEQHEANIHPLSHAAEPPVAVAALCR